MDFLWIIFGDELAGGLGAFVLWCLNGFQTPYLELYKIYPLRSVVVGVFTWIGAALIACWLLDWNPIF